MRRITLAALIAAILMALPAPAQGAGPSCTVDQFKSVAKEVYRPWYKPIHGKWRLRKLKECASATRRELMRVAERRIVGGRKRAIARFHRIAPYEGPNGTRWAIPWPVVWCESGSSGLWHAQNGVYVSYAQVDSSLWSVPWPIRTMADKMGYHREVGEILDAQGTGAWPVCQYRGGW